MPELPEVNRAANLVKDHAIGKVIVKVDTNEDSIVFAGVSHTDFANEITGRKVIDVVRYGKVFYIKLEGEGRLPVLHFGMTGNVLVKGQEPLYYKEGPKKGSNEWPPRFMKFIIHLSSSTQPSQPSEDETETLIAFVDARRLGRIRLCVDPRNEPPISGLGFDPILSMPSLEEFSKSVTKRTCPIKALLLDQSFNAGVGNWVADEILYQSRVHPEQRCNTLSEEQLIVLHRMTSFVCQTAVSVNADAKKFPTDWLFRHRWGKGKRGKEGTSTLKLPSGEPATIKWLTVGGRTSAYVVELQKLDRKIPEAKEQDVDEESELTALSDTEEAVIVKTAAKRSRYFSQSAAEAETETQKKRTTRRKRSNIYM